jgi:hypothetical protein
MDCAGPHRLRKHYLGTFDDPAEAAAVAARFRAEWLNKGTGAHSEPERVAD